MQHRVVVLAVLVLALIMPFAAVQAQDGAAFAHIRITHFSPDTPAVDVYLNGEFSGIQTLRFGEVSGWVQIFPSTYSVAVAPAGTSLEAAAIGPVNLSFRPGTFTTIAATGSLDAGTLGAALINENYTRLTGDEARVTVFHGIADAPAVDVILPDGTALVRGLSFGRSATLTVPAGTYDLAVVAADTTGPAVLNLGGTTLNAQTFYLVAATNTLATPQANLTVIEQPIVEPLIDARIATRSIAQIAAADARFSTLVTALQLTGLDDVLAAPGTFTVFAPTNAAFNALPAGLLDALIADPDALAGILRYHVVAGRALAADVVSATSLNTLNGSVSVEVRDEGVFLNGNVRIIQTDIRATNGVIHVIDAVLVP